MLKYVLLFFVILKGIYSTCKINVTIDISDGTVHKNGTVYHNGTYYLKEHTHKQNERIRGCVCEYKTCFIKCCLENQHFSDEIENCVASNYSFNPKIHSIDEEIEQEYHIINTPEYGTWCDGNIYMIEKEDDGDFKIQKEGHVSLSAADDVAALQFCVDHLDSIGEIGILVCEPKPEPPSVKEEIEKALPAVG